MVSEALDLASKLLDLVRDWLAGGIRKRTLIVVPHAVPGAHFWSVFPPLQNQNEERMSVASNLTVTNVSDRPIQIIQTLLKVKPRFLGRISWNGTQAAGSAILRWGPSSPPVSEIRAGAAVLCLCQWLIQPPIAQRGATFSASVCLVDNLGHKSATKIRFPYIDPKSLQDLLERGLHPPS